MRLGAKRSKGRSGGNRCLDDDPPAAMNLGPAAGAYSSIPARHKNREVRVSDFIEVKQKQAALACDVRKGFTFCSGDRVGDAKALYLLVDLIL